MKTSTPLKRSPRGSSLIEAMISLTVLAIALLGMSGALVASTRQDRVNSARAAAQMVANELAEQVRLWSYEDPRLEVVNAYTGADFSHPRVTDFTLTHATDTTPASATDTFDKTPDHDDAELDSTFPGRAIDELNLQEPGRTYAFHRYWNVKNESDSLKLIAIHVSYQRTPTERDIVSVYTAVYSRAVLVDSMGGL